MVFQSIGGRNSIVVPGRLENAGLFETMCARNVGLGLGRFHNARGYQLFWKPTEAKRTAPVVYRPIPNLVSKQGKTLNHRLQEYKDEIIEQHTDSGSLTFSLCKP
ncbi:hypothetical protein PCASD_15351 [Puccinia coronata f. sp. avenae]|uniref:Uncharacterized protein n=1 Tax=Puccinia coronata f. sp. avenae TaxID=200324 RepID=A0A2N5UHJ0_9BASI|nr:hypothetical protein PCASD_15351 [Puccinia coronata f. sp. avenae]